MIHEPYVQTGGCFVISDLVVYAMYIYCTYQKYINSINHWCVLYLQSMFLVYSTYINCIFIEYKCLYSVLCSGQPQQRPHCVWQGICFATPGNDARHIQGCYCGPHNRVARHTGDSRWVGNRASAAAQSRWNGKWKVQGQGNLMLSYKKYILVKCIAYTMHIPCISNKFIFYIQNILITYTLHMLCISHVYFVYILIIYLN
jgi:hypothetical protein